MDTQDLPAGSVDPDEVARFAAMSEEWWDPDGKFRPLHNMNPVRLEFVRDRLAAHFGRDPLAPECLANLRLLDVGCGGGLICEPMTRLGASVTGIDAAPENVSMARIHAERMGLDIDYRHAAPEALAAAGESFDAVICLEVVEHVADVTAFLESCCRLVRPGGALALSTINRTMKAYAFAVVGAEYVLRWLPRGTHQWRKFVRPSELARGLREAGARLAELKGASYDPLADQWQLGRDLSVNYFAYAVRD